MLGNSKTDNCGRTRHTRIFILEKLRNKYIHPPPEGMTSELVKGMTDSALLDMHYFLTEDDDWDGDEPEEGFYIDIFQ